LFGRSLFAHEARVGRGRAINGSGSLTERYLFGPGVVNGAIVSEILARTSSAGTTDWYLTDKLGSVNNGEPRKSSQAQDKAPRHSLKKGLFMRDCEGTRVSSHVKRMRFGTRGLLVLVADCAVAWFVVAHMSSETR
jgi:hypothetical protein